MAAQKTSPGDTSRRRVRPVVLCILDGWGHRDNGADSAIDRPYVTEEARLGLAACHGRAARHPAPAPSQALGRP